MIFKTCSLHLSIITSLICLALSQGCGSSTRDNNISNVATDFRTSEYKDNARVTGLRFMAQLIRECANGDNIISDEIKYKAPSQIFVTIDDDTGLPIHGNRDYEIERLLNDNSSSYEDKNRQIIELYKPGIADLIKLNDSFCHTSVCSDLAFISMQNAEDFILLLKLMTNISLDTEYYGEIYGELQIIAESAGMTLEDMIMDIANKSGLSKKEASDKLLVNIAERVAHGIDLPDIPTSLEKNVDESIYYLLPYDFGSSPFDIYEHARFLIEMERIRCPIASEAFVSYYSSAIDRFEASLGQKPYRYSTFANRVQYFSKLSYIHKSLLYLMIHKTDDFILMQSFAKHSSMINETIQDALNDNNKSLPQEQKQQVMYNMIRDIAMTVVQKENEYIDPAFINFNFFYTNKFQFPDIDTIISSPAGQFEQSKHLISMMIPGYNALWFNATLISNIYHFPEQFIMMHLIYPNEVADFYRHIKTRDPVHVDGIDSNNFVNRYLMSAFVPPDFGEERIDILMAAKYWSEHMPMSNLLLQTQWLRDPIVQSISRTTGANLLPPKYSSDASAQQYFSQFNLTPAL